MTDSDDRRRVIALAEQDVERQRALLRHRTLETRQRFEAAQQRIRGWKVPLILIGGALIGVVIGRPRARRHDHLHDQISAHAQAPDGAAVTTAKAAGKAAGLMAGLSLARRLLPVALSLLSAYAERRGRVEGAASAAGSRGAMDWWSLARGVAPLIRR